MASHPAAAPSASARRRPSRAAISLSPRIDGAPHRPWSSLNIRRGEKLGFDVVHSWLALVLGVELSQWDAFSIVWTDFLKHADLPPDVVREIAAAMDRADAK